MCLNIFFKQSPFNLYCSSDKTMNHTIESKYIEKRALLKYITSYLNAFFDLEELKFLYIEVICSFQKTEI